MDMATHIIKVYIEFLKEQFYVNCSPILTVHQSLTCLRKVTHCIHKIAVDLTWELAHDRPNSVLSCGATYTLTAC